MSNNSMVVPFPLFNTLSYPILSNDDPNFSNSKSIKEPHGSPQTSMQFKDSRWLTLEICREHLRNRCLRNEMECKFAHPPKYHPLEIHNGRVICCYDFIKGKCNRKTPPCKYLHPPQHLKEQLVQNGRKNLLIKNIQQNIFHNQIQTNSFYGPFSPLQIKVSNIYQTPQQSTILPSSVIPNFLQYMFPVNLFPPFSSEIPCHVIKDTVLPATSTLLPNIIIHPFLQTNQITSSAERLSNIVQLSTSQNQFNS